jgi:hypothetical protein
MILYIITDIICDFRDNEFQNYTYYFNNEKEAVDKLVEIHDEFCRLKIKKKCKECGWIKGPHDIIVSTV